MSDVKELNELRIGEEYDRTKLWLSYEIGADHLTVTTGDSQFGDNATDIDVDTITRLRVFLTNVEDYIENLAEEA